MGQDTRTAVVTGVSSGIGRAICAQLIKDGWHVFGSVRKDSDADAARDALGDAFTPLVFDVTDEPAIAAACDQVSEALAGRTLNGLVNNAGIAVAGPARYVSIHDLKTQFDVNVYGVVRTSQAFLPLLGADHEREGKPGKIINISSLSGRFSVPFMSPYSMSKYAVEALSDAMRAELLLHGVDVVIVEPGPVKTPIFAKTEELDFSPYRETEYADALEKVIGSTQKLGKDGLEPEEVGNLIVEIFNNASPKTRYPILKSKFSRWTLPRLLPDRLVDRALARRVGIRKRR
ncbi:SDR family NAD(P)-dependent oxidoreductase [Pyruvatibacter sp. HU-CL02332]|uniref:SDR family oxidoreductase n=1 Tax=Pyruvatibacter sp. HU-CL02332 TaxID=3127650 RepID=UPI003107873D